MRDTGEGEAVLVNVTLQSEEMPPLGPNIHKKASLFSPISNLSYSKVSLYSDPPASPGSRLGAHSAPIWGAVYSSQVGALSYWAGAASHLMTW